MTTWFGQAALEMPSCLGTGHSLARSLIIGLFSPVWRSWVTLFGGGASAPDRCHELLHIALECLDASATYRSLAGSHYPLVFGQGGCFGGVRGAGVFAVTYGPRTSGDSLAAPGCTRATRSEVFAGQCVRSRWVSLPILCREEAEERAVVRSRSASSPWWANCVGKHRHGLSALQSQEAQPNS